MSTTKNKYYVLWDGDNKGIYEKYDKLRVEVYRLENEGKQSYYKGFMSRKMAEEALSQERPFDYIGKSPFYKWKCNLTDDYFLDNVSEQCMYVDSIVKQDKSKILVNGFSHALPQYNFQEEYIGDSENIAKYLAIYTALHYQYEYNIQLPIYSSSTIAICWIKSNKIKPECISSLSPELYKLVMKAQWWLRTHEVKSEILLWKTKKWGQIPASYKENVNFTKVKYKL